MGYLVSIASLEIKNFGPFYGKNSIDFSVEPERPPHILIGGKNGAGKTHLLRAFYLATVGKSGVVDLRNLEEGTTKFNFAKVLNRRAGAEGEDVCELVIKLVRTDANSGDQSSLTIHRQIRFTGKEPNWKSWAIRSGDDRPEEDEEKISTYRETFLPYRLARFFFFDAERSQNINLNEEEVVKAINRVLGMWSYEELEDRLRNIARDIGSELQRTGGSNTDAELGKIDGEIQRIAGEIKSINQKCEMRTQDNIGYEEELAKVENNLKTIRAVDPELLKQNQQKSAEIKEKKNEAEKQLHDIWEKPLPVALLGEFGKELLLQLENENERRRWEERKKDIEPRIPQVKDKVFDNQPLPAEFVLDDKTRDFYVDRLENALRGFFEPPPQGVDGIKIFVAEQSDTNREVVQILRQTTKAPELLRATQISDELGKMARELNEVNREIQNQNKSIAEFTHAAELLEQRAKLRASIENNAREIADMKARKIQLDKELAENKKEETLWTEKDKEAKRSQSLASCANAYRDAATELRKRASEMFRNDINKKVGELWTEITGREEEFSGMEFDVNWNCHLIKKNGERVDWDDANTSAGQRQVRLLAFYEALRQLAQSVPPLVVDTPLGRLDKEVRESVLKRLYLSDKGHQSVVLSTNAEIDPDGELFAHTRDQFGRAYTLEPIGNAESQDYIVKITEHYFGKRV